MILLKIGATYEHVKTGKRYKLIAVGKEVHDLTTFVFYDSLYENSVSKYLVRSKEKFVGEAVSNDGSFHPRFIKLED